MSNTSGKLIAISGIDGSGKTTVAEMIKEYLGEIGIQNVVIVDAMKGGCYTRQLKRFCDNNELRQSFSPELLNLTWSADLIYTYNYIVIPYINAGYNVIMHRSDLCCRVYSRLFAKDDLISQKLIDTLDIHPNLHIYLDVTPEMAYERISLRNDGQAIEVKEKVEYLKKAEEMYQQYLNDARYRNVITVDTSTFLKQALGIVFEKITEICKGVM